MPMGASTSVKSFFLIYNADIGLSFLNTIHFKELLPQRIIFILNTGCSFSLGGHGHNRCIRVLSVRRRQKISKLKNATVSGAVSGASELSSAGVLRAKDNKVVQCVSKQWSDLWSDHRIRKQSIVSLDILMTLTLCKLVRPLSGTKFGSRDWIYFRMQPRYMVCKNALFERIFEQKNRDCIWNCVSGAKTRARECT